MKKRTSDSVSPAPPSKSRVPSAEQLLRPKAISNFMIQLAQLDETQTQAHHAFVRLGIYQRYELAQKIATDEKLFPAFKGDEKIKALKRPPKNSDDTLRCLFQATYADPKKASKYFKRVEPFWLEKQSVGEVRTALENYGVSAAVRQPKQDGRPRRKTARVLSMKSSSASRGDRVVDLTGDELADGYVEGWQGEPVVGHSYDLRVKVTAHSQRKTSFEVLSFSPASTQ